MVANPFKLALYDKAFNFISFLGAPASLSGTLRHNALSTVNFAVSSDHHLAGDLLTAGTRLVLDYNGNFAVSGQVRSKAAKGPNSAAEISCTVVDDLRILQNLGMPNPTGPQAEGSMPSQGADTAYYKATGTAEDIVKDVASKNLVTRLGLPVTFGTNLHRGTTPTGGVQLRFHPMSDKLLPMADANGIGVTVRQSGAGFLLDVYTPTTYPQVLTEASGVITDWSWSQSDPEATRVVSGGQGEGTARVFRYLIDDAREAEYNDIIEIFRDARDADSNTVLDARAQETLNDGAPRHGLSLTLAETDTFRYGDTFQVGDIVTANVGGLLITDVLREVTFTYTTDEGVDVTPSVGDPSVDEPDAQIAAAIRRLAQNQRDSGVR